MVAREISMAKSAAIRPGLEGGTYRPLSDADVARIHEASLHILENIGIAGPTRAWADRVVAAGGTLTESGRLCFPRSLVEDCIAKAARNFTMFGREERHDVQMSGNKTYFAGSTAAIQILDPVTGEYRHSTLKVNYDMIRLSDALDNVHFVQRPIVARELDDSHTLDLNTAYSSTAATTKHIITTFFQPKTLKEAITLYDYSAGGSGDGTLFRKRPFASTSAAIVVSPLRFAADSCVLADVAVNEGIPLKVASVPQSGATGPVTLAGTLAMGNAEVLAGFVALNLLKPGCELVYGLWPFVSDLRSGAFVGGGGEMGLLAAGTTQLARFYDLPNSIAAGITSSKEVDVQSGWERGYLTLMAGLAGANMIKMAMGGLADNVSFSPLAMVMDESMLSGVLRSVRGIEVTDDTLALDDIETAAHGPGHFLGETRTLELMEKEYVYPDLADRNTVNDWLLDGSQSARSRAAEKMNRILAEHFPQHINDAVDDEIRRRHDIRLPRSVMRPR